MRKLNNAKKKREREKVVEYISKGKGIKLNAFTLSDLTWFTGTVHAKEARYVLELSERGELRFAPFCIPAFINTRLTTIVIASRIPPGRSERMRSGWEWGNGANDKITANPLNCRTAASTKRESFVICHH